MHLFRRPCIVMIAMSICKCSTLDCIPHPSHFPVRSSLPNCSQWLHDIFACERRTNCPIHTPTFVRFDMFRCLLLLLFEWLVLVVRTKRQSFSVDAHLLDLLVEEMEMKIGSANTSPINDSTSTIDTQGEGQKEVRSTSFRIQSSQTILTEVAN